MMKRWIDRSLLVLVVVVSGCGAFDGLNNCTLQYCPNGYKRDVNGSATCECADATDGGASSDAADGGTPSACKAPKPSNGCDLDTGRGCDEGQQCKPRGFDDCVSSYCTCDEKSGEWLCTRDCADGVCQPVCPPGGNCVGDCPFGLKKDSNGCEICECNDPPACRGPNPADGCHSDGECGPGNVCRFDDECHPSLCSCDATSGSWICTDDCESGGVCVPRCPSTPPCGIFCQYGLKSDANGCQLCECAPAPTCPEPAPPTACNPYAAQIDLCPSGTTCRPTTRGECLPSGCICDRSGKWVCNADCAPGVCAPRCSEVATRPACGPGFTTECATDADGCITSCRCVPDGCPGVACQLYCAHGFQRDANGCEICACNICPQPTPTAPDFCLNGTIEKEQDRNGCVFYRCVPNPTCAPITCPGNCPNGLTADIDRNGCASNCRCIDPTCSPPPPQRCASGQLPLCHKDQNGCTVCECLCAEVLCALDCPNGFVLDANGCNTCTCKPDDVLKACRVDSDCEKTYDGCCSISDWTAVSVGMADKYHASLGCDPNPICPAIAIRPTDDMPECINHQCVLVKPIDILCGVRSTNPHLCPPNYQCLGPNLPVDGGGHCYRFCGGIAGFTCPDGTDCEDNPWDGCDPNNGGADCGGICTDASSQDRCGGCKPGDYCAWCWGDYACIPDGAVC